MRTTAGALLGTPTKWAGMQRLFHALLPSSSPLLLKVWPPLHSSPLCTCMPACLLSPLGPPLLFSFSSSFFLLSLGYFKSGVSLPLNTQQRLLLTTTKTEHQGRGSMPVLLHNEALRLTLDRLLACIYSADSELTHSH